MIVTIDTTVTVTVVTVVTVKGRHLLMEKGL
jgi:hypothetical protein